MTFQERDECPTIERMARTLAAEAGLAWESFQAYPGYFRNMWRDEAIRALGLDGARPLVRLRPADPHCAFEKYTN